MKLRSGKIITPYIPKKYIDTLKYEYRSSPLIPSDLKDKIDRFYLINNNKLECIENPRLGTIITRLVNINGPHTYMLVYTTLFNIINTRYGINKARRKETFRTEIFEKILEVRNCKTIEPKYRIALDYLSNCISKKI